MRWRLTQLSRGRALAALACALAALAAAVAAAVGPALPDRATYSWPPTSIPDKHPTRSWFAPLLLNQWTARTLTTRIPCSPGPSLKGVTSPFVVLATARHPRRDHALEVTYAGGTTSIRVGTTTLARFSNHPSACTTTVHFQGSDWTITRTGSTPLHGHLNKAPIVYGLITQLDLHTTTAPETSVTPRTQDTHPSGRQTVFRVLAALLTGAAFWLAVDPRRTFNRSNRPARTRHPVTLPDATIVVTLLAWWIVGPTYVDDGWAAARQQNSQVSGGFSNFYDSFGANLPLGTWWEWLQHFVLANTTALFFQRIPSLVCIAIAWVIVRTCLTWVIGPSSRRGDVAWWTAALVFCTGATGYLVTLRPEPVLALLAVGTLACALRFARRPALPSLALAVLLAGLAVTEHPAGLLSLAPLVICLPQIVREARARAAFGPLDIAGVAIAGVAWVVLLEFLDSDIGQRRADAALVRAPGSGHQLGPLDELQRYGFLGQTQPIRREFVVVLLLLAVWLVVDRRPRRTLEKALPAASVAVGLVLLAFAPSKWLWHFGGFVGLAGVAAGVEMRRLRERTENVRRSLAVAAVVIVATVTSALVATPWGPTDLRTFDWADVHLALVAIAAVVVVLVGAAITHRLRRATYTPILWLLPAVLASLLVGTTTAFIVDSARADRWTVAREALTEITSGTTCGLGDEIRVPDPASMRALAPLGGLGGAASARPTPPVPDGATLVGANAVSHWYELRPGGAAGFYLGGAWRRDHSVQVDWGRAANGRVQTLATGTTDLDGAIFRRFEPGEWRFVGEQSLPPRPAAANAVRLRVGSPGTHYPATVTSVVSYRRTSLRSLIEQPSRVTLASPFISANIPCARPPVVTLGVAEAPSLLIDWSYPPALTFSTSPFIGTHDLYEIRRLPLDPLGSLDNFVAVHTVLVDPRDAVAPVERTVGVAQPIDDPDPA